MIRLLILVPIAFLAGCATLTEDAMTPVAISFSDGSNGEARLENKRGVWMAKLPSTTMIRKSDDGLKYDAETEDGRKASGIIPSTMGAKIVASAIFLDLGIIDAITDKHRKYPASFVIPIAKIRAKLETSEAEVEASLSSEERIAELDKLLKAGTIPEEEYAKKKKEILDGI